jgi:V/A-type H+-transporting ATPase subunit E
VLDCKGELNVSIKDGLSAITSEVLDDVQKEAEAIILAAENEAKETLKAAKEQADQKYQTIINQAKTKAETERRKITSVTEVEMRNRLLQTKEDLVDNAFEKALVKLQDFVKTEEYHEHLLKLIEEVAKRIDSKNLMVQVNAEDKTWLTQNMLNRLSKKPRRELKLSDENEDFIGGCKIQTVDGKITYDSTIDNRLQELKPTLRVEAAKILFGKEA